MPTRNIYKRARDQYDIGYYTSSDYQNWQRSPRVNGKIVLRSNPLERWKCIVGRHMNHRVASQVARNFVLYYPPLEGSLVDALLAESYAKFRGKLYEGSAALGVTAGSYKQSRSMIVTRATQLAQKARGVEQKVVKAMTTGRLGRQAASAHLEAIFGWAPLLGDIYAAAFTVIDGADVNGFIRARASGSEAFETTSHLSTNVDVLRLTGHKIRVTRAARVTVSNPNRWLLERAGLLNPVAVAWDLVPWSWALGMFVNTGQLVNSITDFAGLTFHEQSLTINSSGFEDSTYLARRTTSTTEPPITGGQLLGIESHTAQWKRRTLTAAEVPNLTFRIPDANWETAALAASLMTQQFNRLGRLASVFNLSPRA